MIVVQFIVIFQNLFYLSKTAVNLSRRAYNWLVDETSWTWKRSGNNLRATMGKSINLEDSVRQIVPLVKWSRYLISVAFYNRLMTTVKIAVSVGGSGLLLIVMT
jgi:hypothetical protein